MVGVLYLCYVFFGADNVFRCNLSFGVIGKFVHIKDVNVPFFVVTHLPFWTRTTKTKA